MAPRSTSYAQKTRTARGNERSAPAFAFSQSPGGRAASAAPARTETEQERAVRRPGCGPALPLRLALQLSLGDSDKASAARGRAGVAGQAVSGVKRPATWCARSGARWRQDDVPVRVHPLMVTPPCAARDRASVPPDSCGRAEAARPGLLARADQATSLGPV